MTRDQTLRRERGHEKEVRFPCSADHKQDWKPYSVDAQSAERNDHMVTYSLLIAQRDISSGGTRLIAYFS